MSKTDQILSNVGIVSVLPPARSGIAHFTNELIAEPAWSADVYAPAAPFSKDDRARGLEQLPANLQRYQSLIFLMGNSPHWLPVLRMYHHLLRHPRRPAICLYLHDPCCLDLVRAFVGGQQGERTLKAHYPWAFRQYSAETPDSELIAAGITGSRVLFSQRPPDLIFVNSNAARGLLMRDFPEFPADGIRLLFHPVFEPKPLRAAGFRHGRVRIGTFGMQQSEKCSDTTLAAFRILRQRQADAEFVIAGYNAAEFADRMGIRDEPGFLVCDSPDDATLDALIASVSIAVQLRAQNRGESSGIVCRALGHRRPTIVSQVGAFLELGEAVCFATPGINGTALADLIACELAQPSARTAEIERYVRDHTANRFLTLLGQELAASG